MNQEWEVLLESMADKGAAIPAAIRVPTGDCAWSMVSIERASLDELDTAIVALDLDIDRLSLVRAALEQIRRRARRVVTSGSTTVYEALMGKETAQQVRKL